MSPSRISKIFDHYLAEMKAALPCHNELMDPDDLFENPAHLLSKGYGLIVGAGRNSDRCMESNAYYYEREFTIILTREVLAQYSDAESRKAKWKDSLEDLHLVLKRLTGSFNIVDPENPAKMLSFKTAYADDSGPRATTINDTPYVFIELTVSAEYREPTTGGS